MQKLISALNKVLTVLAIVMSLYHLYTAAFGLPEALFTDRTIQDYPPDYNYSDEQWRFGQAGRLWQQAASSPSLRAR